MESAVIIVAGWCSGVNAYLTVVVLGVAGRFGWAPVPATLQQPWVLALAGVLFAVEFVVDKVPLLDSAWDMVHTLVRPSVGATVGVALATAQLGRWESGLLAGGLAVIGHVSKSTARLAINVSPEPFTNIVASLGEDGLVGSLMALVLAFPRVAAIITGCLMVVGVVVAVVLFKVARRGWRMLWRWTLHGSERP